MVAHGPVHLRELQSCAYSEPWQHICASRTGSHRLRELAVCLLQVATVHSEPGRDGEGEHAGDVVMHPILIDSGERQLHVPGRLRPLPAIHGQHRELGLAVDERIGVAHCGGHGGGLCEQGTRLVNVSGEQMRLGAKAERRVAPDAPRRLLRDGEACVGHHLLRARGTHDGSQHRPRRVERCRAVGRHQVERSGVDDRRPALRFGGLAGEHSNLAGQHGQRGIFLDRGVAQRRQPALHGR